MMRYRVYLWGSKASQAADVVQEVEAATPDEAIQAVMRRLHLGFVYYAWVVPVDEDVPTVDRYAVRQGRE